MTRMPYLRSFYAGIGKLILNLIALATEDDGKDNAKKNQYSANTKNEVIGISIDKCIGKERCCKDNSSDQDQD